MIFDFKHRDKSQKTFFWFRLFGFSGKVFGKDIKEL